MTQGPKYSKDSLTEESAEAFARLALSRAALNTSPQKVQTIDLSSSSMPNAKKSKISVHKKTDEDEDFDDDLDVDTDQDQDTSSSSRRNRKSRRRRGKMGLRMRGKSVFDRVISFLAKLLRDLVDKVLGKISNKRTTNKLIKTKPVHEKQKLPRKKRKFRFF